MDIKSLCPDTTTWQIVLVSFRPDNIVLHLGPLKREARCPLCGTPGEFTAAICATLGTCPGAVDRFNFTLQCAASSAITRAVHGVSSLNHFRIF